MKRDGTDKELNPEQMARMLIGKTIAGLDCRLQPFYDMVIDAIRFTDGSVLRISGQCECAFIEDLNTTGGECYFVSEQEGVSNVEYHMDTNADHCKATDDSENGD